MTNSPMSNNDKQALLKAAEKAGADEWRAFIDTKSKTYAVHTPGDNRCGDVVKWAGFDGQQKAANKARYIAAANPAAVLSLLDELEAAEKRIAELQASHNNLREAMAGIHNTITGGGAYTPLAAILNASKRAYEESAAAAGKGE